MKSYNEMADSVMRRSEEIFIKIKKRRRIRITTSAGVCFLLVLSIVLTVYSGVFKGRELMGNYGQIHYLSRKHKNSSNILGVPMKTLGDYSSSDSGEKGDTPGFYFSVNSLNVVAKAVERYPEVYKTLYEYGDTSTRSYRLFRMQIIDPLDSGMSGEFFYLLPKWREVDLTKYDALLIALYKHPDNFILRCEKELVAFDSVYSNSYHNLDEGYIMAFSGGVFDGSLWEELKWPMRETDAYYWDLRYSDCPIEFEGAKLEDILARRRNCVEVLDDSYYLRSQIFYEYNSAEAQAVTEYIKPFENGVFIRENNFNKYLNIYRRYIDGCPTNEWISISIEKDPDDPSLIKETVKTSDVKFENKDFKNLPSISKYLESLDLTEFAPQHISVDGMNLLSNNAVGWYEKIGDEVYSIVKISWKYRDPTIKYSLYYDETFILLDSEGDRIISREDLIELIGYNENIPNREYGKNEGGDT